MIRLADVTRDYRSGEREVHALDRVTLEIGSDERVAVTGPSGCGKSTLLHLLAGLDRPSSGELYVDGVALHAADDRALTEYRRRTAGIVFQFFNLMPTMTVLENVTLPMLLQGGGWHEASERARGLIATVGLSDRISHFPHQLSGGEQQRTAIARALLPEPKLLLADEPTGNLDSSAAATVLDLLRRVAQQKRTTLVVVTHSEEVAQIASRRLQMYDGKIVTDSFA